MLWQEEELWCVTSQVLSLQANWPKNTDYYLMFERLMLKMICEIDSNYEKCVLIKMTTEKKKMYEKLTKAVYETLLEAILFY